MISYSMLYTSLKNDRLFYEERALIVNMCAGLTKQPNISTSDN